MDIPRRPEVLRWARARARLDVETLAKRIGTSPARVSGWESDGGIRPKQVEKLARVTARSDRRIARGARGGTEEQSEDPDRLPGSRCALRPDVCDAPRCGPRFVFEK
jgi:hypothetical protein